jgi:hypothetical protein
MDLIDLTGKTFGKLTVKGRDPRPDGGRPFWFCQCSCGNTKSVRGANLKSGNVQSCGCLNKKTKKSRNLVGTRIGKLVVIAATAERCNGRFVWLCQCDCGNTIKRSTQCLVPCIRDKRNSNCGCFSTKGFTKNMRKTPTYVSWKSMNNRCNNPNNQDYKTYGAAGISVCDRWHSKNPEGYTNFLRDMEEKPKGLSLGRFGDIGNYCPENCKWMTNAEQGVERSKKHQRQKVNDPMSAQRIFSGLRQTCSMNQSD